MVFLKQHSHRPQPPTPPQAIPEIKHPDGLKLWTKQNSRAGTRREAERGWGWEGISSSPKAGTAGLSRITEPCTQRFVLLGWLS